MPLPRRLALLAVLVVVPSLPGAAATATGSCTTLAVHVDFAGDAPNANGCTSATFTATPNPVDIGATVTFDGSQSVGPDGTTAGGIGTYEWDFGDGSPVADVAAPTATTTHAYGARGRYTATLLLEDSSTPPQPIVAPAQVEIYVSATPVAAFTAPAGDLRPNISYGFDASASSEADSGTIVQYDWDWGDGTTSQTSTPLTQHTFTGDTLRDVTVTAINDLGLGSAPVTHTVHVHDVPPVVHLTGSPAKVTTSQKVTLGVAASSPDGGSIVAYQWDLDSNNSFETSTGTNPSVSAGPFPNPGVIYLSVKAIDDSSGSTVSTVPITVVDATGSSGVGSGARTSGSKSSGGSGGSSGGSSGSGGGAGGGGSGSGAVSLGLSGTAIQRLTTALRGGVVVTASANRKATGTFTLTISAGDARKLHLIRRGRKAVTIGTLKISLRAGRASKPKIKLTRKAARALRHAHPRTLRVTVRGTVIKTKHVSDGDVIVIVTLDPEYAHLANEKNDEQQEARPDRVGDPLEILRVARDDDISAGGRSDNHGSVHHVGGATHRQRLPGGARV